MLSGWDGLTERPFETKTLGGFFHVTELLPVTVAMKHCINWNGN